MLRAARRQLLEPGQPALGRPQHFECIERRHARPRLLEVETRIGENDAGGSGTHGEAQREPLFGHARRRRRKLSLAERSPRRIREQRVLDDLAREDPLRQPRDADHVEDEPACSLDRGDEYGPVAPAGGHHGKLAQPRIEHEPDLVEPHGTDGRHRLELREGSQDRRRRAQRRHGERAQVGEPLAPRGALGERGEPVDEREGHRAEVRKVAERARKLRGARLVALLRERVAPP